MLWLLDRRIWIALIILAGVWYFKRPTPAHHLEVASSSQPEKKRQVSIPSEQKALKDESEVTTTSTSKIESEKIAVLKQILNSKNDNDPRLDQIVKDLAPESKRTLRQMYTELPQERRNERGTIVFVLGREIQSQEDLDFFRSVLQEPACMSLENCHQILESDAHHQGLTEVTLAYPQIMAAKSLFYHLQGKKTFGEEIRLLLHNAERSNIPTLARTAHSLNQSSRQ